jgi:hypothetical protein
VNPYKDIDEGFESFETDRLRDDDEVKFRHSRQAIARMLSFFVYAPTSEILPGIIEVKSIMLKGERESYLAPCASPREYDGGVITFTTYDGELATLRWDNALDPPLELTGWSRYDPD